MKSKIKSLIIIIIGMVLIIAGGITFVSKLSSTDNNDLEEPDVKEEPKELRKILEEEISNETAKEIIQFYLDKDSSNEKYKILNATILASNEKCAAGTYSTGGAGSCTACPSGQESAAGASSCCERKSSCGCESYNDWKKAGTECRYSSSTSTTIKYINCRSDSAYCTSANLHQCEKWTRTCAKYKCC